MEKWSVRSCCAQACMFSSRDSSADGRADVPAEGTGALALLQTAQSAPVAGVVQHAGPRRLLPAWAPGTKPAQCDVSDAVKAFNQSQSRPRGAEH